MKRSPAILLAIGLVSCLAPSTQAQIHGPHNNHQVDRYRNSLWPMPFRSQDTCSVLTYFDAQRNKGWQLANTLGNHCFDSTRNSLTDAGHAHLEWIIRKAPPERRVVFILRSNDDALTRQRIETTQLAISRLIPTGTLPELYVTGSEPLGSSGAYQTAVHRAIMETVPAPRLIANPAVASSTSTP